MSKQGTDCRNLILLHLESVSQARLWQFRQELAFLGEVMGKSMEFTRFYTSSTSSSMTEQDVVTGTNAGKNGAVRYGPFNRKKSIGGILYRDLYAQADYNILWIVHRPPYIRQPAKIEAKLNSKGGVYTIVNETDFERFHNEIANWVTSSKSANRPFFIYFWEHIPHLVSDSPEKAGIGSFATRFRYGFNFLDNSLKRLWRTLEECGCMDDTTTVGYGDHGDELWTHGLNKGYCHATEGYASLCWTPMFIHDSRLGCGVNSSVASSIDIRPTVMRLLFPECKLPHDGGEFLGIDLLHQKREYAFTQNLYALQGEFCDPEHGLAKSYAVTDGVYRVLACSDGGGDGAGGMEFYCDILDPDNAHNLLTIFGLDENGSMRTKSIPELAPGIFQELLTRDSIREMGDRYDKLRRALMHFIQKKEKDSEENLAEGTADLAMYFPQRVFFKVRLSRRGNC